MPPEPVLKEVEAWMRRAESDFRNIELVLPAADAPFDTVCFHAQQAAEKYLKALLTYYGVPFGRTHDLPELLRLLPSDSALPQTVGDLSELADAAVLARSPSDPDEFTREVATQLVEQARAVKSAVIAELKGIAYTADS